MFFPMVGLVWSMSRSVVEGYRSARKNPIQHEAADLVQKLLQNSSPCRVTRQEAKPTVRNAGPPFPSCLLWRNAGVEVNKNHARFARLVDLSI
jgi:hypothetical protein